MWSLIAGDGAVTFGRVEGPPGHCLHAWIGWDKRSGDGNVDSFQLIWIRQDWISKDDKAIQDMLIKEMTLLRPSSLTAPMPGNTA